MKQIKVNSVYTGRQNTSSFSTLKTANERIKSLVAFVYGGKYAGFSNATGVSSSLLSRWINNGVEPSISTLIKMERASGWSAAWMEKGTLPAVSSEPSHAYEAVTKVLEEATKADDTETAELARYLLGTPLPPQANEAAPAATDTLSETARALKAQGDNLMPPLEQIEEPVFPRQHTLTIPYYDIPVNAGQAVPLDITPPTLLVFDYVSYKNPNKLFGVLVSGDSMIGVGIVNRSRLICERTEDVERAMDRVVIACTQDGTVVKLLTRNQEGRPVLRSDNPAKNYPDIMVDETVRIQAIVVKALNDI